MGKLSGQIAFKQIRMPLLSSYATSYATLHEIAIQDNDYYGLRKIVSRAILIFNFYINSVYHRELELINI